MSELTACTFGAIAVTISCGAVQFALGRDLSAVSQPVFAMQAAAVNRAAKADRPGRIPFAQTRMQTLSLQLNGVLDASVLVRIPLAEGQRAPSLLPSGFDKAPLACEPVVSVLTEAAKQLPPGRCVT